jgi:histone H1/5
MAVDKSTWNKKVKVSQSTIDDIKGLGMAKALRLAKMNAKGPQAGLVKEYQEATRRLYGDRRFAAATGAAPKKAGVGTDGKQYNPKYASKPSAAPKKASTSYSPTPMKTPAKKSSGGGISNTAKVVAGTAAAAGILLATRGRGAGLASKLAPGLMKNKAAQALLTGEVKKTAAKAATPAAKKAAALVERGKAAAAAGKPVSEAQLAAMRVAAKAAKKATPAAKKAAAKKVAAKKTAAAPRVSRWDANAPKVKPPKK